MQHECSEVASATATSTTSLHSKFSKIRNQFQPNSLKWSSSNGFYPMFCLTLSNKRSILVVSWNYNVSHSMLLGSFGHQRSFLRWRVSLEFFGDFAAPSSALSPLEGPVLACLLHHRPDCWAPKQGPEIQAKADHRNVGIFQITVTHIGNCTTRHHIWPSYHWRRVHVVDQRDAILAQRPVLRSLQQIRGSGGMTLSSALSVYPCSLIMSDIAASCCFFHRLKAPPGTNQRPQRIQRTSKDQNSTRFQSTDLSLAVHCLSDLCVCRSG